MPQESVIKVRFGDELTNTQPSHSGKHYVVLETLPDVIAVAQIMNINGKEALGMSGTLSHEDIVSACIVDTWSLGRITRAVMNYFGDTNTTKREYYRKLEEMSRRKPTIFFRE